MPTDAGTQQLNSSCSSSDWEPARQSGSAPDMPSDATEALPVGFLEMPTVPRVDVHAQVHVRAVVGQREP
jgi:hypothetical protein